MLSICEEHEDCKVVYEYKNCPVCAIEKELNQIKDDANRLIREENEK